MTLSERLHRMQSASKRLAAIQAELHEIADELDSHQEPILAEVCPPGLAPHRLKGTFPVSGAGLRLNFGDAKSNLDCTISVLQTAYADHLPVEDWCREKQVRRELEIRQERLPIGTRCSATEIAGLRPAS